MAPNADPTPRHSTRARPPFGELPGARHFSAEDLASWPAAEARYRRLVQRCHPDRRIATPSATGDTEFIEITTAFKRLREHYQRTGQLPTHRAANQAAHMPLAGDVPDPGEPLELRRRSARQARAHGGAQRAWRRARLPLAAAALLCLLLTLVVVLDKRMESNARERAAPQAASEQR